MDLGALKRMAFRCWVMVMNTEKYARSNRNSASSGVFRVPVFGGCVLVLFCHACAAMQERSGEILRAAARTLPRFRGVVRSASGRVRFRGKDFAKASRDAGGTVGQVGGRCTTRPRAQRHGGATPQRGDAPLPQPLRASLQSPSLRAQKARRTSEAAPRRRAARRAFPRWRRRRRPRTQTTAMSARRWASPA